MKRIEEAQSAIIDSLTADGTRAYPSFPKAWKRRPGEPVVTVHLKSARTEPCGFGGYLGLRRDGPYGEPEETYGARLLLGFQVSVYLPGESENGAEDCAAVLHRVMGRLTERPIAELRVLGMTAGEVSFDERLRLFRCDGNLAASILLTADGEEGLPVEIDLSGRIYHELP